MAADLHIHVLTPPCTDHIVKRFGSNVLGGVFEGYVPHREHSDHFAEDYDTLANTPNVWVGEVSWLKAALFDDEDRYVPGAVGKIDALFDEGFRIIDEELVRLVIEAFGAENKTGYSLSHVDIIVKFLRQYIGERAFVISW